ncbi:uncharacterized protein LOC113676217 [Pocillopora damicornis]|uniref:uncharacterized protein LOC113676217 n=1 Tax=Pocillopora damicornis TaxID=46731 RepID=UPI000F54E016|nr:uncharacterized protein LOC113676217 [Pocillopora damicornis]
MIELRQDSLQQSKSLRWISILLGAILVALGIHSYVLIRRDFKEHSLSSELKELRKMVEELSSKVAKTEGENENLREELFNTEISRQRRNPNHHPCHLLKHCKKKHHKTAEEGLNCTLVMKCQPEAFIHMSTVGLDKDHIQKVLKQGNRKTLLFWGKYDPLIGNKIKSPDGEQLFFELEGWYSVYLNLRVSANITEVKVVNVNGTGEMSFTPIPSIDTSGKYFGTVHISRLLKISRNTKLSVQVVFKAKGKVQEDPKELFPNCGGSTLTRQEDNFGAFLVS